MIINSMTMVLTLVLVLLLGFVGLRLIRQFAYSIALENHEANQEMDAKEDKVRRKKIELADQAASDAFQKVEPLISSSNNKKLASTSTSTTKTTTTATTTMANAESNASISALV